ncbi:MAG: zinc dependent phospholipase C family protein [Proteobacteria bacterium]|nr:zinc dependent phospholipase C family protein [Pseudomonadota bacterium]
MRISLAIAASAASLLVSTKGFSWGQKGHQMINHVAVSMVNHPEGRKFLTANQEQIRMFASTPDTAWKSGASAEKEKPLHWFEIDGYNTSSFGEGVADMILSQARSQLGQQFTTKYGLALWRVSTLYQDLVAALRDQNWERSIQVGGVIGHYVGDMTQPMHSSTDYDGQSINKPGVHKYYETTLVNQIAKEHLYDTVLADAGERRHGLERSVGNDMTPVELQHLVYDEAETGFNALSDILGNMDDQTNDEWLTSDLKPRLARASAVLGKIWDAALTTAQVKNLPKENIKAAEPRWMPMEK